MLKTKPRLLKFQYCTSFRVGAILLTSLPDNFKVISHINSYFAEKHTYDNTVFPKAYQHFNLCRQDATVFLKNSDFNLG